MNELLTFRSEVTHDDLAHVRELARSTGFFTEAEIDVAVELVDERLSKGERSGYDFVFAEQHGRVVGYTCFGLIPCTISSYDLYWIVVHDSCRGQGVGKALMAQSEARIRAMGGTRVYIETSSRAQYQPTRYFYFACNYQEAAVLADFYAPGDGKVMYLKVLASTK